jgi:hypothetical protein
MEVRSSRRVRTLVTQMARSGLSANEIAPALIPMMARSETLQSKAGYIDARPLPPTRRNSLATQRSTPALVSSGSRYPAIALQSAEVSITKRDSTSVAYENRTKSAKCGGLEKTGREREFRSPMGSTAVRRFVRDAPSYWAFYVRSKPAENVGRGRTGGGKGTGIQPSPV